MLFDLPVAGLDDLISQPVLILAPHPDDETLGCGGMIADCCVRGYDVRVVVLTDGSLQGDTATREGEAIEALATLGLLDSHIAFLGLKDGDLANSPALMRQVCGYASAAGTVCTTWGYDPHPDHQAAFELGQSVAGEVGVKLFCYPITLDGSMVPPRKRWEIQAARLDISDHLATKCRAIDCYKSQLEYFGPGFLAQFKQPHERLICESAG